MVGDYVMTQNNIRQPAWKNDSIAVGDWSFDEHMTGKYAVPVGGGRYEVQLEGNFWPKCGAYDVPYRIMVPKRGTGANLLVPVAFSASAVAYSSTRIEGMFMGVGTAAGVAAKQLVDGEVVTVQDVAVAKVQYVLEGSFKGLPQYHNDRNVSHGLYLDKGAWRLAIRGREVFYVAPPPRSSLPALTGWTVASGTAPPPVLVAGPTAGA